MNRTAAKILAAAIALVTFVSGCGRTNYKTSGLKELSASKLLESLGAPHELKILDDFAGNGGRRDQYFEMTPDWTVRVAPNTRGGLLLKYRAEIEKRLFKSGGASINHNAQPQCCN